MADESHKHESAATTQDTNLLAELHDLTSNLRGALDRFRIDARLTNLAEKEIPNARERLNHVLSLTDNAAHRTMDLVEQSGPVAERIAQEAGQLNELWTRFCARKITPEEGRALAKRMSAFLNTAQSDSDTVRANLAEMLLAQGYQDLTGQIIRSVMTLVGEVEKALADLARLARGEPATGKACPDPEAPIRAFGPPVPGVDSGTATVSGQQDVDALLSRLGM